MSDELLELGRVGRPHGVRGEVRLFVHNPGTELPRRGQIVELRKDRVRRRFEVVGARAGGEFRIVRLRGVEDRQAAASLTHSTVWARRSDFPDLAADELYLADLIGVEVQDAESGRRLGEVRRLGFSNVDVLEIALDDGAVVLVPVIGDYVTAMSEERVVVRNLHHWSP